MSKKPPDEDIINLETLRSLVHSRFDGSLPTPRSKARLFSPLNARLFGEKAVNDLIKIQQEELEKIEQEEQEEIRRSSNANYLKQPGTEFHRGLSPITE